MAPLVVAYYVTGHGLGHATRVAEIVRRLAAEPHGCEVHVVSGAPAHVFEGCEAAEGSTGRGAVALRTKTLDCGARQADALSVDREGSLQQYLDTAVRPRQRVLAEEAAWLASVKADVIVSDIVPLACAAAAAAGVPCVCVSNFSWDFVYSEYFTSTVHSKELRALVWQIAEDYSRAELLLRLPGHTPMPAFRDVVDVPLVVRPLRRDRAETRAALGVPQGAKLVLYQFGGQEADWGVDASWLPDGWRCVVASTKPGGPVLPPNWSRAPADAYTPDLVAAADCVLGKIGYGTASESLAYGVPLVFVRRDHFNEEPFLRKLLELHECSVEMARRDFFAGHWQPYLERAVALRPRYERATDGGVAAAEAIVRVARGERRAPIDAGPVRLRDAIVFGFELLRSRSSSEIAVPEWYTKGNTPDVVAAPPAMLPAGVAVADDVPSPHAFEVLSGTTRGLRDTHAFLGLLSRLGAPADGATPHLPELRAAASLFWWDQELVVTRAPGRLDVMGGIADYSGSLVLEMPIAEACHVALQRQPGKQPAWRHTEERYKKAGRKATMRIVSLHADDTNRAPTFDMDLTDFLDGSGSPISYNDAREYFARDKARSWAAYLGGCLLVLMREKGAVFEDGLSMLVSSEVPEGKGVSSSAAVEVATMQAVATAYGVALEPRELAILCQKVENLVVGAACGVMDQMTSACGEDGKLLAMECRPAEVLEAVPIPAHVAFWGVDSGIRHSVGGADYGSVRVGAFMGRRIVRQLAQDDVARVKAGDGAELPRVSARSRVLQAPDAFHLAELAPHEFERAFAGSLPETISGVDFMQRYGDHGDAVTSVDPWRSYPVRAAAAHPVHENFRTEAFSALLRAPGGADDGVATRKALGQLMLQAHESYSRCGLGSAGTDRLVALSEERGLPGAKITGGGSGGTVCVLTPPGAAGADAVRDLVAEYARETGHAPRVFSGSSPGAGAFGHLRVRLRKA